MRIVMEFVLQAIEQYTSASKCTAKGYTLVIYIPSSRKILFL